MHLPDDIPYSLYVLLAIGIILFIVAAHLRNFLDHFVAPSYRKRCLFSEAEKRFFRALEYAVRDEKVMIFGKVRLADIFSVEKRDQKHSWRDFAKISQKHVDYLVVDMVSLEPVTGIELDDSSHLSIKSRDRDRFVDGVFKAAELPLHHFRASGHYDPEAIRQTLFDVNLSTSTDA